MGKRPLLGITMGDPAGCGPEILIKALSDKSIYGRCRPLVIGDAGVLRNALRLVRRSGLKINEVSSPGDGIYEFGIVDVLHLELVDMDKLQFGKVSAMAGNAAFQCVKKVIELAMAGDIDATVTNPLNKEALNLAGYRYSGHTEIYADYTGTAKYSMMLVHHNMRVIHVSTHVSLRKACDLVKKDRILDVIRLANKACMDLGIENPRIGVAGLNPHSGENGMFGDEEIKEIIPAIEAACAEGLPAEGPIPPDTVFPKARGGWYDIVVCMYHDQGHIPLKVVGFIYNSGKKRWDAVEGVNITLGLPIIRTSVDHGTAFDYAGTGEASEMSLVNAIDYAIRLSSNRKGNNKGK